MRARFITKQTTLLLVLCTLTPHVHSEDIQTRITRGFTLLDARNKEAAKHAFMDILKENPHHPRALIGLATVHHQAREYAYASRYYTAYLTRHPFSPSIARNLLATLHPIGLFDASKAIAHKLCEAEPNNKSNKIKALMLHLRDAEWNQADKFMDVEMFKNIGDMTGKKTVVQLRFKLGDSGYGDIFQFARFAKRLKEAGAHVTAQLGQDGLRTLFERCPYIDAIVTENEPLPQHDVFYEMNICGMMHHLKDELHQPSRDVPYLYADPQIEAEWHQKLASDTNIKIGIFWQRGMVRDFFTRQPTPCSRSMHLKDLAPLTKLPGVSLYSLDYRKIHPKDIPSGMTIEEPLVGIKRNVGTFIDSAAFIKCCDYIVTVDSATAHLAAALNVPTLIMLPTTSCYRWFHNRSDSPYYPSARLFKQTTAGDWRPVVAEVTAMLKEKIHA